MDYTVLELLNKIVYYEKNERKEYEFYQEDIYGGIVDVEYYLKSITCVSPKEKFIIISDCHEEPLSKTISINTIANQTINVDGIMIYYYVQHNEEYVLEKIEDYNELYCEVKKILNNCFFDRLIVFVNGEIKDYCVKDQDGQIIHRDYDTEWLKDFGQIRIEWL